MDLDETVIQLIVCGGQEGVDEEAAAAAIEFGIPVTGVAPVDASGVRNLRRRAIHTKLSPVPVYISGHEYEKYRYRTTRNVEKSQCVVVIHAEARRVSPAMLALMRFVKSGYWRNAHNDFHELMIERPRGSKTLSIDYYPHGFRNLVVFSREPRSQQEVSRALDEMQGFFLLHGISRVYFVGSSSPDPGERVRLQFFFRCFFLHNVLPNQT